jgi:hypothetical protein
LFLGRRENNGLLMGLEVSVTGGKIIKRAKDQLNRSDLQQPVIRTPQLTLMTLV